MKVARNHESPDSWRVQHHLGTQLAESFRLAAANGLQGILLVCGLFW
jgi:hypothetical protein